MYPNQEQNTLLCQVENNPYGYIYQNPLIKDDSSDILYNARSVLAALKDYYCATDLPNRGQDEIVYTGLFWILKLTDEALAFESERVKKTYRAEVKLNG